MRGDTTLSTGAGLISMSANGDITIGKLRSTNTNDLVITSSAGAILDADDGETDIIVTDAKLVFSAATGIGSGSLGALEIQVKELDLQNTASGAISILETDTISIQRIVQAGSTTDIETLAGFLTIDGSGINAQSGDITLTSIGDASYIQLNSEIRTTGGGVSLETENGDVTLAADIHVIGTGDISITATNGSIFNDLNELGWLTEDGNHHYDTVEKFEQNLKWAISKGKIKVDVTTGEIIVDKAIGFEETIFFANATILKEEAGVYIRTSAGDMVLKAKFNIGGRLAADETALAATETFNETKARHIIEKSTLSLLIDAETLIAGSDTRQAVLLTAVESISIIGSGSKGGATTVMTLSGNQIIAAPIDASGENLEIATDDIIITDSIRSVGAQLVLKPVDSGKQIIIGDTSVDTSTSFYLDSSEIAFLKNGFGEIVIGSDEGNGTIIIGDQGNASKIVTFSDTLILKNPVLGGHIFIYNDLIGTGDASLIIEGSGHTTTISADVSQAVDVSISDSILMDGIRTITAGTGGSGNITLGTSSSHTINGDGVAGDDGLILNANAGNISIEGVVGGSDALESFIIVDSDGTSAGAINVTFDSEVTMNGDMTITASGTVTFNRALNITGNLTILGAGLIVFEEGVAVSGNIILEGDEINFKGGEGAIQTTASGSITMRTSTVSYAMSIASPPAEATLNTLNITATEIAALADGFSKITFGHEDLADNHANASAGSVRVGVKAAFQQTFRDNVTIFGGSIEISDYSNPDYILKASGNIILDAVNNIDIKNEIEATSSNLTMYSESGKIRQQNDTGDAISSESLRANDLIVTASTGIDLAFSEITNLTASNTGDGNIDINIKAVSADVNVLSITQTNAGFSGNTTLTTENGNIVVAVAGTGVSTLGAGSITLDANDTGTDKSVTINKAVAGTSGSIIITSDAIITTTATIANSGAGEITITSAKSDIAQGADITSAGGLITIQAQGTSGIITQTSGVKTSSIDGSDNGAIIFEAASNVLLSQVEADGSISITATAGAITDNLTAETANIFGDSTSVTLTADTGIGTSSDEIDLQVTTFAATNTTSGGIYVEEANDLIIGTDNVSSAGSDGTTHIKTANGTITVTGSISNTGTTGDILLQSQEAAEGTTANIVVNEQVSSDNGNISLLSADDITQSATGDLKTDTIAKTIDVLAAGSIIMSDGATAATTNNGNIRYEASTGSITIGGISAGTADVTITAAVDILDGGETDIEVVATNLRLKAGNNIGASGNALDITVTNVSALSTSGNIYLNETDALVITKINAISINRVGTGVISDAAAQEDLVTSTTGSIVVLATDIDVNGGDDTTGITSGGAGNILLNASSLNIDVAAKIDAGSGHITLLAKTDLTQSANGDLVTTAGSIDLETTDGSITMTNFASSNAGSGNIRYNAKTTLTLASLNTSGDVSLLSSGITDAGTTESNVVADELRVITTGTGGFGTSANHIETTIATLSATVKTDGLYITESNALVLDTLNAISVNRVGTDGSTLTSQTDGGQSNLTSTGQIVLQTVNGSITVNAGGVITATNDLLLKSGGTTNIVLAANVTSINENLSIDASQDLLQNAGSKIFTQASGKTIDLKAGNDITSADTTSIVTLDGDVRLEAAQDITLELITAGTGNVALLATRDIKDGDTDVDITAASLVMSAGSGIGSGSDLLETTVTTLAASASTDGIFIQETDAVIISNITSTINRVSSTATTSNVVSTGEDLTTTTNGAIVLIATDIDLNGGTTDATSAITAAGSGNILINATASNIDVNAKVDAGSGHITMLAQTSITQAAIGHIATTAGSIDIEATTGSITMTNLATTNAGSGNIRYNATSTITLASLSTSGDVS
ncbi:hypothetical protein MJH12_03305, partial [bacterium]|nr:hypothetical protein [bacterium]